MRDSPTLPISPNKYPQKNSSDSEDKIPSSRSGSKRPNATETVLNEQNHTTTCLRQNQLPNVLRAKRVSTTRGTELPTCRQGTQKQRGPFLFLRNMQAKVIAQFINDSGRNRSPDPTRTSTKVSNRSVPEQNRTSYSS